LRRKDKVRVNVEGYTRVRDKKGAFSNEVPGYKF
jgi:hypothetical protein